MEESSGDVFTAMMSRSEINDNLNSVLRSTFEFKKQTNLKSKILNNIIISFKSSIQSYFKFSVIIT